VLNKILGLFPLAVWAEADEFKQVAIYSESCLFGETLLRFFQFTAGEVNNLTAVRADQVVVMPWGTNCVAAAAISGM